MLFTTFENERDKWDISKIDLVGAGWRCSRHWIVPETCRYVNCGLNNGFVQLGPQTLTHRLPGIDDKSIFESVTFVTSFLRPLLEIHHSMAARLDPENLRIHALNRYCTKFSFKRMTGTYFFQYPRKRLLPITTHICLELQRSTTAWLHA